MRGDVGGAFVISDRFTASAHSPVQRQRPAQSRQYSSVSRSAACGSIGGGGGRCDAA